MRIRYALSLTIAATLIGSIGSLPAHAHAGDYYAGTYTSSAECQPSLLKFKIESSAQTALLTSNVYYAAFDWNDISSNVEIGIAMSVSGMPSTGFYLVIGEDLGSNTTGQLRCYNSSGTAVSANSNWHSVKIVMNTAEDCFYDADDPLEAAQKAFIHEVGHALKLAHPTVNPSLSNHIYQNGVPVAVMNQGYPNDEWPWITSTVTQHDRVNLIAKWGHDYEKHC